MAAEESLELGLQSLRERIVNTQTNPSIQPQQTPVSPQSSNTLTHEEVTQKIWKYMGYKRYTDTISHTNDFLIIRRFGILSVRVLLALQDKVVVLEEQLNKLDDDYSRRDAEDIHNGSFRKDKQDRRELIWKIHSNLKEYFSFAKQFSDFAERPEPYARDVQSLNNWLDNNQYCIHEAEREYLSSKMQSDLFPLVPKKKSPLRKLLDKSDRICLHEVFRRAAPSLLPEYETRETKYISDGAIERATTVIIISLGLAMLLAPAWILEFLDTQTAKLGVISTFVILFTCMVQYAMVVKHGETLVAAAAYAAVLMVFLQLGNSG